MPVNITQETLFDLTLQLSRIVQNTYNGDATATSPSTDPNIITDTNNDQIAGYYADTVYQGTAWLPVQGTLHTITTHTLNTLTISPNATPVTSGEDYYAAPPNFPLSVLKQSINRGLRDAGKVETIDTFTSVADQEIYTSTDDATFGEEIVQVFIAHDTAAPYEYTEMFGWEQDDDRTFRFHRNSIPGSAYSMRIVYLAYSAELSAASDEISVVFDPEYIIWLAAVHALRWKVQQTRYDDQTYIQLLNEAQIKAALFGTRHRQKQNKKIKVTGW